VFNLPQSWQDFPQIIEQMSVEISHFNAQRLKNFEIGIQIENSSACW
jgi:hypothetical protein